MKGHPRSVVHESGLIYALEGPFQRYIHNVIALSIKFIFFNNFLRNLWRHSQTSLLWTKMITVYIIFYQKSFTVNTSSIYRVPNRSGGWHLNLSPTSALLGRVMCGPMGFLCGRSLRQVRKDYIYISCYVFFPKTFTVSLVLVCSNIQIKVYLDYSAQLTCFPEM